jgi:hypothetical protein
MNNSNGFNNGFGSSNNNGADAFVAALLQQQPAGRGRALQQFPVGAAAGATNGLANSGIVQARQASGRGRAASARGASVAQQQQQQQQNTLGRLAGSLGQGQAASGRGQSASTRGRGSRQQQQSARQAGLGAGSAPQLFAPNGSNNAIQGLGMDRQALATLMAGSASSSNNNDSLMALSEGVNRRSQQQQGSLQQQQPQTGRRARSAANSAGAANGFADQLQQQQPQTASRRGRSAAAGTLNNAAMSGSILGGQQQQRRQQQQNQIQGQSQQQERGQQNGSRRVRSAGNNANGLGQFGASNGAGGDYDDGMVDDAAANGNANNGNKNKYILVDESGNPLGPKYTNSSAYGAALKAALNYNDIYLWDRNHPASEGGRVYSYVGGSAPITNPSEFTMRHGITTRPMVKSRGYVDLDANRMPIQRQSGARNGF